MDNLDIATVAEVVRDEIDLTLKISCTEAHEGNAESTHTNISKANRLIRYELSHDFPTDFRVSIGCKRNRDWCELLVLGS